MNGRDEELLSAYYDGELPDDEQSCAAQLLSDDPSARELLDDLADVAGWIRALPRPSAPADTRHAVLARLQRATAPLPAASRAATPRSNWRRRAVWATVSVAGLLVALVLQRSWTVPGGIPVSDATVALSDRDTDALSSTEEAAVASLATTMRIEQPEPAAVDTWHMAMSNSIGIQQRFAEALERGEAPVIGEERADLTEIGDRVVVIRYRVVDRLQLPGEVQLVLTQKGITEVSGDLPSGETEQLRDSDSRQLAAFYVEAPESDLTSAVATFTTLDGVTDVTTNFVATTTAPIHDGLTIADADQDGEAAPRSEQPALENRRSLAFDALASGRAKDDLEAPAATPAAPAPQLFDDSPSQDRPLALDVAEAAPARSSQFAAPRARGYQVAVPAEQELIEELQVRSAETTEHANGVMIPQSRVASARQPSSGPTRRNLNDRRFGSTAPPPADRVRAVIVLLPEPAE